jgi:Tol biopolymer transport system component
MWRPLLIEEVRMTLRWLGVAALAFAAPSTLKAEDLFSAMTRSGFNTVLIIHSQAIDEHPVWSPKGDALAFNIEGKWVQASLASVGLVEATWHSGSPIAVVQPKLELSPIPEKTVRSWEKVGKYDPSKVQTSSGTVVEFKPDDLSTEFLITRKGSDAESQWKTGLESCHSLGLSPDENYVAYVCETNGVIVTALR